MSRSSPVGSEPASAVSWLRALPDGLWCEPGRFFIDPVRPVERAVITHGHADHARPGHARVLATPETIAIMKARYGEDACGILEAQGYGDRLRVRVGDVDLRFVPAGHILGSAQVVLEYRGARAVVSGDFKRRRDPTCAPFETVGCDVFITEATFGLPVFRHPPDDTAIGRIFASLRLFPDRPHLIGVYALGKCQRLVRLLRDAGYDRPIWIHGALQALSELYERHGVALGDLRPATAEARRELGGEIVLCPPSALADRWNRAFKDPVIGLASGWMLIRQRARQRGVELPVVLSDHADWDELTRTIADVGAGHILVTHGREDALVHYARTRGLSAAALDLHGYEEEGA